MLPEVMPAFRAVGVSANLKNSCLVPLYRDAGVTFAQGLYRFDNVTDREFHEGCIDALQKIVLSTSLHPVILVTVSKTMKKYLRLYGAKPTESADQFIIDLRGI